MILIIIAVLAPERTPYRRNVNHRHGFRHAFSKLVCSHDAGSICVPPQQYIRYSIQCEHGVLTIYTPTRVKILCIKIKL